MRDTGIQSPPATRVDPLGSAWDTSAFEEILSGLRAPEDLRRLDRRGMTPGYAASVQAAVLAARLMVLLDQEGQGEGQDVLGTITDLLQRQVEQQAVIIARLEALITLVSPRMARLASERAQEAEQALPPAPKREGRGRQPKATTPPA